MKILPLRFKLKLAKKLLRSLGGGITYSQNGEDIIIREIFNLLKIESPSYIDIGAHHPFNLSNTALFYENGSHGVNIDANPLLLRKIAKFRKGDINLAIGIGSSNEPMTFYVADASTVSTFSKEKAELACKKWGVKIIKEIPVEVHTLKFVIEKYCGGVFPDFLTLDTEGLDPVILSELKELSSLPKVICTELTNESFDMSGATVGEGCEMLEPLGYTLVMRTRENAIFVLKDFWTAAMNR